jgi:16S rRNA (guanine1516-N2)-methyltransferase
MLADDSVAVVDFSREAPALFRRTVSLSFLPVTARSLPGAYRYLLDYVDGRLCIVEPGGHSKPFHIDLNRGRRAFVARDLLRRALGRGVRSVVDATAGFGRDAAHLASLGVDVTAIERCAPIAALLVDALGRLPDSLRERITVLHGDSLVLLRELDADAVFLDPMYSVGATGRCLPRRPMVLARSLAGDDQDAPLLLALARERFSRVVVKRPDKSAVLAEGVHHSHKGKTVRYDVYLDPAFSLQKDEP